MSDNTATPHESTAEPGHEPARLHFTSNDDSELFVVDGNLHLAGSGVGEFEVDLAPGAYKIRVMRAGVMREELFLAQPGTNRTIDLRIEAIEIIGPSAVVLGDAEHDFGNAIAALNRGAGEVDPGLRPVFVFASAPPDTGGSLFRGIRVFPWRNVKAGIALSTRVSRTVAASTRRWEIARLDLPAGMHVLDLPAAERRVRVMLPVMEKAEMHVSLRRRLDLPGNDGDPDRTAGYGQDIAVQLRRNRAMWLSEVAGDGATADFFTLDQFLASSCDLELEHGARQALSGGRRVAIEDRYIYNLLHLKYEDPITGLAAAHLMFDAMELRESRLRGDRSLGTMERVSFSDELLPTVLANLSWLFGHSDPNRPSPPENPDLAAILLRAGIYWPTPFELSVPPLFWRSWQVLLDHGHAARVRVEPRLWSETKVSEACGPYFSWDPQRISVEHFVGRYAQDTAEIEAQRERIMGLTGRSFAEGVDGSSAETGAEAAPSVSSLERIRLETTGSAALGSYAGRNILRQTARHLGVPRNVLDKLL